MEGSAQFVIPGQPVSKANSRQLVNAGRGGRPLFIKSKKAREYQAIVKKFAPLLAPLLEGDLTFTAYIWYASRRPDLDESLLLDALQGKVYKNDRQVREKHIYWALDKENPRALVIVRPRGSK